MQLYEAKGTGILFKSVQDAWDVPGTDEVNVYSVGLSPDQLAIPSFDIREFEPQGPIVPTHTLKRERV